MAKQRKRESRYPYTAGVALSAADGASLESLADQDGIAVGVLIRSAFLRGWPAEREARRKARAANRKSSGSGDGPTGAGGSK